MAEGWQIQDTGERPVEILIGMRWTALWRLAANPWVPVAFASMVRPGHSGLVSTRLRVTRHGPAVAQAWRDRASLDSWSRTAGAGHLESWMRFARETGSTGAWGIWHQIRFAAHPGAISGPPGGAGASRSGVGSAGTTGSSGTAGVAGSEGVGTVGVSGTAGVAGSAG